MVAVDPLRDLLDRAAEGDDVALGSLVRRTQDDVVRLCRALGSDDDVDDLVQETYLRMIRSVSSFRGESSVRTWLLSIARHTCADQVRARQRTRRLIDRLSQCPVTVESPAPSEPDVLLDGLSPERREAFVLTQVLDLSYDQAADVIGCPVGTVRSRVHRAREDLIAVLDRFDRAGCDA